MWVYYKNGNYNVLLNKINGTKIRYNELNFLKPDRPESIDVKITNQCNHGCLFCHEASIPSGKQATYKNMKKFAQSLAPYTEIAVGGGSLTDDWKHTQYFLEELQKVNAIPSITLHQEDFIEYSDIIEDWYLNGLIYGIGVSLSDAKDEKLHKTLSYFPTAVIHVIAGLFSEKDFNYIANKGYKLLILGYKKFRRGNNYYVNYKQLLKENLKWLKNNFVEVSSSFNVLAFDNLALEQLDVCDEVSKKDWEQFYMGDDGQFTFYVDLVENTYAKNSRSIVRFRNNNFNINEMFKDVQRRKYDTN